MVDRVYDTGCEVMRSSCPFLGIGMPRCQRYGSIGGSYKRLISLHALWIIFSVLFCKKHIQAGCGFGLKLSRLFATYLGGHLVVTTDEGQGTAVSVSLKRRAATEVLHPSLW